MNRPTMQCSGQPGPGRFEQLSELEILRFLQRSVEALAAPDRNVIFPHNERKFMNENRFHGYWRIIEMEMWDQDFIDAEVPGYIQFNDHGMGDFQFGYVHGFMDCRFSMKNGKDFVEFSWEGNDEMDLASGRGFATIDGRVLNGHLFFHQGDNSEFKAIREQE